MHVGLVIELGQDLVPELINRRPGDGEDEGGSELDEGDRGGRRWEGVDGVDFELVLLVVLVGEEGAGEEGARLAAVRRGTDAPEEREAPSWSTSAFEGGTGGAGRRIDLGMARGRKWTRARLGKRAGDAGAPLGPLSPGSCLPRCRLLCFLPGSCSSVRSIHTALLSPADKLSPTARRSTMASQLASQLALQLQAQRDLSRAKLQKTFPSPFKYDLSEDRGLPYALQEIKMLALSYAIRSKDDWRRKAEDPEIRARWREEAHSQEEEIRGADGEEEEEVQRRRDFEKAQSLSEEMVDYVLDELELMALQHGERTGIQVSRSGVWENCC